MRAKTVLDILKESAHKMKSVQHLFPGDFDDFEKRYKMENDKKSEVIERDGLWQLLKNPGSLESLGEKVRGIITETGDLYIENFPNVIHQDILEILVKKNILNIQLDRSWGRKLPEASGFLTVQRCKDGTGICIGESNKVIYDEDNYKKYIEHYKKFLNAASKKNPDIKFIDKLVGVKFGMNKGKIIESNFKQSNFY